MKNNQIVRNVFDNFYLRNLFVLLVLISVHVGAKSSRKSVSIAAALLEGIYVIPGYVMYIFHNLVLYKKLLARKRYLLYVCSFLAMLFAYRCIYNLLLKVISGITMDFMLRGWIALFWVDIIYIYLALGVYLAFTYYKDRERLLHIENEKKELELKQLSQQLNPHFLFNALNNIYSYLLLTKDNGRELILKLSELMRYILDSSKKEQVTIQEEISFIEHYITFEKERLGDRCTIEYHKEINQDQLAIVPLLLFIFIENAFKHGTAAIRHSVITIKINAGDKWLKLYVANPIHNNKPGHSTGTGLKNAQRRLELLYPGRYQLHIEQTASVYSVSLEINDLS